MSAPQEEEREYSTQLKALLQQSASTCALAEKDWENLSKQYGVEIYIEALYRMSRLELPADEARECVLAIVRHQDMLCRTLGRTVSLLTSMCDYFMHVKPMVREPILVEVRLLQQKEDSAYKDELTGLFNRRYFNQEVPREMERFRRFGHFFTLLILDLDHFKLFNDTHGHSAGDQALRDVARILGESARLYDRVVRYGGEEFAVILPQARGDEALAVAERIRQAMEQHHVRFAGQDLGSITVSTGLATFPKDGLDMGTLVQRADQALYESKKQRNAVRAYRDSQRDHPRYHLNDPLPLSLHLGNQGVVTGSARDISFGGLMCAASKALPENSVLHMVLSDTARSIHLPLQAQVRRVTAGKNNTFQMGLSFRLDSVEEQMKLLALMDGRVDTSLQGGVTGPTLVAPAV